MKVKPLLDAFFAWLETVSVTGNNKLSQAVNYALNERKYLYTFFENGNLPIDNNRVENAIRVCGRTQELAVQQHGERSQRKCRDYSVIATAQANGLDTEAYLTELFSQPAGTLFMPWKVQNDAPA